MRWRFDISYDGTNFNGWAEQPGQPTIQGSIQDALQLILRLDETPRLTCAGRTDTGVHARGQVAHVDLDVPIRPESLVRRLARYLPPDVSVRRISEAPDGFHARFSAIERRYVYRLCDTTVVPDPLQRRHIATFRHQLDVTAMNYAAQHLLGDHDFASFCKRREGATTIRTLRQLSSLRRADDVIETTVRANAFCHSMVRSLMGALVAVGEHAYEPEWAGQVLKAGVRHARVTVMPARGLTLEEVVYPSEALLAARAHESRTRRTL